MIETTEKKVVLSGVKPTGSPHVGNYLGAMKQFVDFQDDNESFFMIADYHALTTFHEPIKMTDNIINVALDYLAIGDFLVKGPDGSAATRKKWEGKSKWGRSTHEATSR